MYTPVEKPKKNTSSLRREENSAIVNSVAQKKSIVKPRSRLVDNRPEALIQRRLREMATHSPQNKRLAYLSHLRTPFTSSTGESIQRVVSRKENGQWCSDLLPGQFFDSKEAAEAAEKGSNIPSLKRSGEMPSLNY